MSKMILFFFYYLTSGLLKIYFFLKIFKINKTKFVYGEYFILSKILYDNLSILKPTFFIYEIILKKFNSLIEKRIKKILIENNQIFSKNLLSHNFKKIKKKNPSYLLSICIPAYLNTPKKIVYFKYLVESLKKSLSNCDITNLEINILDNASIIKVSKILKELNFRYNFNLLRFNKCLPPEESLFKVTEMSKSEYVYYLMADDFIHKDFLKNLLKKINKTKYNLYFTKSLRVQDEDYKNIQNAFLLNAPRPNSGKFDTLHWLEMPLPASSFIIKRSFHEQHGVWASPENGADLVIVILFCIYSRKSYYIHECISYFRSHLEQGGGENSEDLPNGEINRTNWVLKNSFYAKHYLGDQKQILYLRSYFFYDYLRKKIDDDIDKGIEPANSKYFQYIFKNDDLLGKFYLFFLYRMKIANFVNIKNFKKKFGNKAILKIYEKYFH